MEEVREWVSINETAKTFISRVSSSRPPLLPPPLHRLPLRPGNIVEIVGPSPSAKTHILLQVVSDCILPKEWKGVSYGGVEQSVIFVDLDCRFDVLRLIELLKFRIFDAQKGKNDLLYPEGWTFDEELIQNCLERFMYIRCYDSLEFLATLKTLSYKLQTKQLGLGSKICFMMIDSIGAYYWIDRASTSMPLGSSNRKIFSFQSVIEAVVREIKNFLQVQPLLVLATKATIFGDKVVANDIKRTFRKWSSQDASDQHAMESKPDILSHREYMPSAWQVIYMSFVTHRISVRPSSPESCADNYNTENEQVYVSQWLIPSLGFKDKFVVRNAGIFTI